MEWMILPFKRYADFAGHSRRKEYWMFFLLNLIIYVVLMGATGGFGMMTDPMAAASGAGGFSMAVLLYALIVFIPALAVQVRRFHDQDKSGWFVLLNFIPFVGALIVIVFMCLEGTRGANRFGGDPKAEEVAA